MTLPSPVLDDRSYEQLRDELLARIPVYAPEWTDRGPSDPGITLLELVAHLGESLLYRFNQIPDQTRLWLLRLLQVSPYPPRSARGLVTFTPLRATGEPAQITLGSAVAAGEVPFRVLNDVNVLPVEVSAAIKAVAAAPTDPILIDEYQRVLDAADLSPDQAEPYEEQVLGQDQAAAGFQPLDVSRAVDRCLWVAVHALDRPAGLDPAALLSVNGPLGRAPLVLGVGTDAEYTTIDEVEPCDESAQQLTPEPGPTGRIDTTLIWQVTTTATTSDGTPIFLPVDVVRDTTDGLRHDGVIALQLPAAELDEIGLTPPDDDLAGIADRPPALADRPPVLFWLRAFPRQGVPELGRLRWIGVNAAEVEQVAEAPPELLGVGVGLSGQELALANAPVVPGTLQVEVFQGDKWVEWTIVDTLAASTRTDCHLLLDPGAGRLRCGDSVRGRVLPAQAPVRAVTYRYGGGRRGLVKPGDINTVLDGPDVTVTNPLSTTGGEDAEPISRALERIPGELVRHDRAVTADDFRELATIPGVGRAECLPRFEPTSRSFDAAGVVSVVVWPTEDPRHPNAPRADATLLRAVCRHLDARRLVTTELYVIPPTYHRVGISVGLAVKKGYSAIGVRRWVELVLRQYLAPLPPYGPDGRGWPLGHRVHGPELEAAVLQVEGVEFVEELKVADLQPAQPAPGTVKLAGWEVPELTEVTVVVGPAPDPGTGGPQPPPAPAPVPVPVPRDKC
ncbi:putative baseplate assembly protein [Micromonospora fulviviridis]|uniref:putative baseplate assembly protein n=1 Tax=Micromonospora fulviviridis TaxID=47860 RepID=UPI0016686AC8|nr:putative baseplate assembly protein [Micromonospora fulviviridis]GGR98324.1 putative baseplate assembly protein [Micromonospora fulviviridis]